MCGIIGYAGNDNAKEVIINGLGALEYRGYDSAGMSLFTHNGISTVKTQGRVSELRKKASEQFSGKTFCGIGHTRWATHGKPSETNAHPHGTDKVMIVHNGIIENYKELKKEFDDSQFYSDTDTEVIAKILDKEYQKSHDPIKSITNTHRRLKGSYALGIIFSDIPDTVFALRKDSPLLIGKGVDGMFIASDISAFLKHTNRYIRLEDGDTAMITKDSVSIFDADGNKKTVTTETAVRNADETGKGDFRHFMLKEIFEEPDTMKDTFNSITKDFLPDFSGTIPDDSFFTDIGTIHIVACGTALHAGLIGRYFIEKLARIPVTTETAGEFRYSEPILRDNDMAIIISQSGETADSLAALRMLNKKNIRTLSVVNTQGSTIAEESEKVIYTLAGQEIAVASTKAFNVQCEVLFILALKIALVKKTLTTDEAKNILHSYITVFKNSIPAILKNPAPFEKAAKILSECNNAFFIGRGYDNYLGQEASLKLKEISYIHSEAYAASELKHGTISLIEDGTPVIAIATDKKFYEKMRSNIEEVKSRGAVIISVCCEDTDILKEISDCVITIPSGPSCGHPFSAATAIQLLAYYTALKMGRDIDKPRNLAKSVTVE